jgi:hypothetical protein
MAVGGRAVIAFKRCDAAGRHGRQGAVSSTDPLHLRPFEKEKPL